MAKHSMMLLTCAIAASAGCGSGAGSRPYDENMRAISSGTFPLRVTGCVMERRGSVVLQAVDPGAAPLAVPAHFSQSTAANGPWIGSRTYVIDDPAQAGARPGSMVAVTGEVTVPHARAAGTDLMQIADGAVYPILKISALEPRPGSCTVHSSLPYQP